MDKDSTYPAMRWHPETGEAITVNSVSEDNETYLSHHPADPDKVAAVTKADDAMPTERVKELLDQGGVSYPKNAKVETLRKTLRGALTAKLEDRGIGFATTDTLEDLFARVTAEA